MLEKKAYGSTTLRGPGRERIAGIGLKEGTPEPTSTKMSEHLQTMWDGPTLEGASGCGQHDFGKVVILSTCQAVNKKAEMGGGVQVKYKGIQPF